MYRKNSWLHGYNPCISKSTNHSCFSHNGLGGGGVHSLITYTNTQWSSPSLTLSRGSNVSQCSGPNQ